MGIAIAMTTSASRGALVSHDAMAGLAYGKYGGIVAFIVAARAFGIATQDQVLRRRLGRLGRCGCRDRAFNTGCWMGGRFFRCKP